MAFVANGFFMSVTLVDNGNNQTVKTYDLQGTDLTEATTNAGTILTNLALVTDATIKGYSIGSKFTNDSFTFPAAGVHIEDIALISLSITDDPTKSATIAIPAPKPGCFVATSGAGANVVENDAPVTAYWEMFKPSAQAYLSDGETAEIFQSGKRIHRGSRRG
jgi:hypothetical protein